MKASPGVRWASNADVSKWYDQMLASGYSEPSQPVGNAGSLAPARRQWVVRGTAGYRRAFSDLSHVV